MDTIQLALDKGSNLKKDIPFKPSRAILKNHQKFLKKHHLRHSRYDSTAFFRLNAQHKQANLIHQNEQILSRFHFLCKHNLLFFLSVTRQFNIIEKLFKTQPLTAASRNKMAHCYRIRNRKASHLKAFSRIISLHAEKNLFKSINQGKKLICNQQTAHLSIFCPIEKEQDSHMSDSIPELSEKAIFLAT